MRRAKTAVRQTLMVMAATVLAGCDTFSFAHREAAPWTVPPDRVYRCLRDGLKDAQVELYQWQGIDDWRASVREGDASGETSVTLVEPDGIAVGTLWTFPPTHEELAAAIGLQERIVRLMLVFGDEAHRLAEAPVQLTNLPTRGENGELPSNVLREVPHAADPASRR